MRRFGVHETLNGEISPPHGYDAQQVETVKRLLRKHTLSQAEIALLQADEDLTHFAAYQVQQERKLAGY